MVYYKLSKRILMLLKKKLQLKNDGPNVENGNRSITYKNLENIVGRFAQYIDAVDLDDLVAGMD